jgi:glycosyltransferase involved in cell wall biosynthesis
MMTVGFLPWWPANPYQILLKQELNKRGVRVIGNPPLNLLKILFRRDGLDVVHVHWPHGLYLGKVWTFPYVVLVLLLYRLIKNNIVWTVHELDFYETRFTVLDRIIRVVLMKTCRALIVHGEHSIREIKQRYGFSRDMVVVHHPSYVGYYADTISMHEARKKLGIDADRRVYLFFGYIKPYKGVEELIDAFSAIQNPNNVLLVAGKPFNNETKAGIEALAAKDPRVRTEMRYIIDDEIQLFMRAADIVVFPFRRTQTSGSIMLALSYGKPVIAPAIATIPEYVDETMGLLFDPSQSDSLRATLEKSASIDLGKLGEAAAQRAHTLSWADMANRHMYVYKQIMHTGVVAMQDNE